MSFWFYVVQKFGCCALLPACVNLTDIEKVLHISKYKKNRVCSEMQLNQHTGLQFSFVLTGAVGAVDLSLYLLTSSGSVEPWLHASQVYVTHPKYSDVDMSSKLTT